MQMVEVSRGGPRWTIHFLINRCWRKRIRDKGDDEGLAKALKATAYQLAFSPRCNSRHIEFHCKREHQ